MRTLCTHCHAQFQVEDRFAGKRARCRHCRETFVVQGVVDVTPVLVESRTPTQEPALNRSKSQTTVSSIAREQASEVTPPSTRRSETDAGLPSSAKPKPVPSEMTPAAQNRDLAAIRKRVMDGFHRPFERPRTSIAYRIGLAAATLFMMLLPVVYMAFIVGTGWLVLWHLQTNYVIMMHARGKAVIMAFLIYLAPAVVGAVSILFMFKPILARSATVLKPRSINKNQEPIVFEFVERICRDVGAPIPKRIDIDNDVNASASFRAGWWSLLRGNDLVLTLGMPLINGLTLQQLAGVVAHEFGHFSQGAGMRISFILRSINHWFVRAVYERDVWDAYLETASREFDIRIGWIFFLARAAVWISRRFLWCLLFLGNMVTGLIQQQMEYDADRYEFGMAGKRTFESTFRSLRIHGVAYQQAISSLARISGEGRLVSNFTKLAEMHATSMTPELEKEIMKSVVEEKTHLFASHPSDRDRVRAADGASDIGAFKCDLPASSIFVHFEAECEGVTKDAYEQWFEKEFAKKKIVPTSEVIQEESRESEAWKALNRFFLEAISARRAFALPNYQIFAPSDDEQAKRLLVRTREAMLRSKEDYASDRLISEKNASAQCRQQFVARLKAKIPNADNSILFQPEDSTKPTIANPNLELAAEFVKASTIRLHTACCMLCNPDFADTVPNAIEMIDQVCRVLPALEAIDSMLGQVDEFEDLFQYQIYCLGNFEKLKQNETLVNEVLQVSKELVDRYRAIRMALLDIPYPFEHAERNITVGQHLTKDLLLSEEVPEVIEAAQQLIEEFYNLRGRCLGRLVIAAEAVESTLGFSPLEVVVRS